MSTVVVILEAMYESQVVARAESFAKAIKQEVGMPGDLHILYTDKGCFGAQFVIPRGTGIANSIALLDSEGNPIVDGDTVDFLTQLYPELDEFEKVAVESEIVPRDLTPMHDGEQIVEVRGSSTCFEYQFPASPEFFVGREAVLREIESFAAEVVEQTTSSRGVVFEANSGWGKSSVVLASVARLREKGHFAIAIDSRTASTSQFIMRAVEYTLNNLIQPNQGLWGDHRQGAITGFDGLVDALVNLGKTLEPTGKVLFIFLDQFENMFFLTDALKRIRDLFIKVTDAQTNVVFGFSWKTDLVGSTNEFPYQIRDAIRNTSKRLGLDTFSDVETNILLDKLSEELRAPVRKDLRFFLSEFSQGYPWLLKKLCAHVKAQRETGVRQQNIADSLLNVEELFQGDLRGLSPEEDDTLRRIARVAPVSIAELGEEFRPEVVRSLVDARLVVRVGPKYDVYWDIFRDYLNAGKVPVQENYILHILAQSMVKNTKLLADQQGELSVSDFQNRTSLVNKSFSNLIREMRLLGLVVVHDEKVCLQINLPTEDRSFDELFREHLRERLRRNRLVSDITQKLESEKSLTIDDVAILLAERCPYISASSPTWRLYSRIFAEYMDAADLATYNKNEATIEHFAPGTGLRERNLLQGRNRSGIVVPAIQYDPIEDVGIRLIEAIKGTRAVDWKGIKRSTRIKALGSLEELELIVRITGRIRVSSDLLKFVEDPVQRPTIFATKALKLNSFATFIGILEKHKVNGRSVDDLGLDLRKQLNTDWKDSTAAGNAKIMLNWARHADLAPGVFRKLRRPKRSLGPGNPVSSSELRLF